MGAAFRHRLFGGPPCRAQAAIECPVPGRAGRIEQARPGAEDFVGGFVIGHCPMLPFLAAGRDDNQERKSP